MATSEAKKRADILYRERHGEELRAKDRERYHQNLEASRNKSQSFKRDNPEYTKEYNTKYQRERRQQFKVKVFEMLGRKCSRCGFDDWRALQIDHIAGGGHQQRKSQSSTAYMKDVLHHGTDKYQILCANCNQIKRHEQGERCVSWEMPETISE